MRLIFLLWVSVIMACAAENLYTKGKNIYFSKGCNGCHGVDAKGLAAYPGLAFRPKPFLTNKLQQYRKKLATSQQAELMIPFARELSDSQIDALTTFFSEYHEEKSKYKMDTSGRGDGGS